MRLCLNDAFGRGGQRRRGEAPPTTPLPPIDPAEAKTYYDMGIRVVGLNYRHIIDASPGQLDFIRGVLADNGLTPGIVPCGFAITRPDPAETAEHHKQMTKLLKAAGRLGFQCIQPSIGSMSPAGVWSHHPDNFTPRVMDQLVRDAKKLSVVAQDSGCVVSPETTQWTIAHNVASMKEFVDRVDSRYVRVTLDFVNHMTPERVYASGRYIRCAVEALGDRIAMFHVKDVAVSDKLLVIHIDEAPMGTGLLDHEAAIEASRLLEPWKTFSLEHIRGGMEAVSTTFSHIQGIADRMGHHWTDPTLTHQRFLGERAARATKGGERHGG
jgi:sugar phosphate isomerase/epimerase